MRHAIVQRAWHESLGLPQLIALAHRSRAAGKRLIGFAYGPERASWLDVVAEGTLPRDLPANAFEVRLFDEVQEWRWWDDGESGRAAWISTDAAPPEGWRVEKLNAESFPHRFLLWGTVLSPRKGERAGWLELGTPRLGSFDVPFARSEKPSGLALEIVEYVAPGDDHGNCVVIEEQIVRLSAAEHWKEGTGEKREGAS